MACDSHKAFEEFIAGRTTAAALETRLAPGCTLETKTETETRFVKDKPVEHWKRECSRISGREDPSNNSDWVCRPWAFNY